MDLIDLLSNPSLASALSPTRYEPSANDPAPSGPPTRQKQRRLAPDQIDEVVARYVDGESIDGLARAYGINRTTVISHLERNGIQRRRNPRKMTDAKAKAAADRYATGISLAVVAAEFGVCDRTLRREFESLEVEIRPRPGWSAIGDTP